MKINELSSNFNQSVPKNENTEVKTVKVDIKTTVKMDSNKDIERPKTMKDIKNGENVKISEKVVIEAIEKANKKIDGAKTEFQFSIHEKTHEIMIKVIDKEKGEIIREIPPEKTLDMVAKMWELAGIIVDEKL